MNFCILVLGHRLELSVKDAVKSLSSLPLMIYYYVCILSMRNLPRCAMF